MILLLTENIFSRMWHHSCLLYPGHLTHACLRTLLFILHFLFNNINTVSAQEKRKDVSVSAGPAFGFVTVKDKTFSELSFSGITAGASVLFAAKSKLHRQILYLDFQTGKLGTNYNYIGKASNNYINTGYTYLRDLLQPYSSRMQLSVGASAGFLSSNRHYNVLINNNRGSELVLDIKAVTEFTINWRNSNNGSFKISNKLALPLAAAAAQPVYGADGWQVPVSEKSELQEIISNARLLIPPAFFRISNRLEAQYFLKDAHSISCSYFFDYMNIKDKREAVLIIHQIGIHYAYRF
jgi:hypothetical protein